MTTPLGFVRASAPAEAAVATAEVRSESVAARDDASYRRIIARQRRLGLMIAGVVMVVLPGLSVVGHVLAGAPLVGTTLAAVFLVATGSLAIAVRRIRADRLWLAAAILGLTGMLGILALTVVEPPEIATWSIGLIALLPIGMSVFATWGFAGQLRWSIVTGLILLVILALVPGSSELRADRPALIGAFGVGTAVGLAAAHLFELGRLAQHRTGRIVHARRTELIHANHRTARSLVQLRAVESIASILTDQGANPAALDAVMGILFVDFDCSHPSIYLGDEKRVRLGAQRGYLTPIAEIAAGHGIIGRALATGANQLVADVISDPDYRVASPDIVSELAVPLFADGRLIGVLNVESVRPLDAADVASIRVVADRVAAACDVAHRRGTLIESEARYQSLVASLHEGVVLQDANGRIVASNPAAERLLGMTVGQLMGKTSLDPRWRAVREDGSDFPGSEHPASIALATREPVLGVVMGVHKPTGELSWVLVDAVPLQADASPAGGVVVSFSDITERWRLQADLLQSQKMDSVGRLAGGIAHDFNNLLTAILGNGSMLAEIVDGEASEHVVEIQRAAERAAELTRQLLGFARKSILDPGDHRLNAIVTDMEPMIRRLVGAHIAVVINLDPAVGHVRVDRSQIDQVLLNLIVNARDAMPDGGTLCIETSTTTRSELDAALAVDADRIAILSVRDSGVGMDSDIQSHVFDPFYTTKPRGRGTGLGLATTHGIVAQSGGAIRDDSTPGEGSTFAVYLPEVQPVVARPPTLLPKINPSGVGTLLLVEDEDAVREVARRILERAGYRVLHAPNANAALSVIGTGIDEIDLLVSDVVMPGMRGPEMYEVLRKLRPDLPAIFLSGYADLADSTDGLPDGSRFLAKPYSPDDLIRIVQLALGTSAA
jgi:PAS domain S-box-containing protein